MPLLLDIDWNFFNEEYRGEKVLHYVVFAGIVLLTLLLKRPVAMLLTRISSSLTARFSYMRHKEALRNMLFKPMERLLQIVLYFIATEQISGFLDSVTFHRFFMYKRKEPVSLGQVTDRIFLFLFILFLTQLIARFIDFIYYLRMGKAEMEKNTARMQLLPLVKEISKLALWIISIFWILGSVFTVNVPALITGLGIGGVAIALAGKETVENFFAAFTILSDKPFQTGDIVRIGEIEGTVERIGFRSTRLRNADGSAYIIPNQNLVSQNLINNSTRDTRGMKVEANIRYGISHEKLTELIAKLKEALLQMTPVKESIDILVETFDKETFKLVISYHLPHPLPPDTKLNVIKREVNLRVFDVISSFGIVGTPVGTS